MWPEPWWAISDEAERSDIERELGAELTSGHALVGRPARAIARRDDSDAVLFSLEDSLVAEVHLTWSGQNDSEFPWTKVFPDRAAWERSGK